MVILSDLRENVHPLVKQRLIAVTRALRLGKSVLPRPVSLPTITLSDGMRVSLCGLGEYVVGHDDLSASPEAVVAVWSELFRGETPTFSAACPREVVPGPSAAAAQPGGVR